MKRRDLNKTRYYVTHVYDGWKIMTFGPCFSWNNALKFAKANLEHYKDVHGSELQITIFGKNMVGHECVRILTADVFSMFKPWRNHNRQTWFDGDEAPACRA